MPNGLPPPPLHSRIFPFFMKEGVDDEHSESDGVVVIFIFLWRRRFTLSPGTTTSPLFACAHAGTPSFIKKENIPYIPYVCGVATRHYLYSVL